MKQLLLFFSGLLFFTVVISCKEIDQRTTNFPKTFELVSEMPSNNNFWIFVLAGQSNMAGRGLVEAQDTIPNTRVLALNKDGNWVIAKEPLHYYEPEMTGLDCGLSFGKTLTQYFPDSIFIGLIPCALGGTTVEQWLGDSLYRGVRLQTNLKEKIAIAKKYGKITGLLWHQGENNANSMGIKNYKSNLYDLFGMLRQISGDDSLPIITGELGSYLDKEKFMNYPDTINYILSEISKKDQSMGLIKTNDLEHKGDFLHFNSNSLRIMGIRYAERFISIKEGSN